MCMGLAALIGLLDAVAVAVSAGCPCGSAFAGSDAASVMIAAQSAAAAKSRSFMCHWRSLTRRKVGFTRTHRLFFGHELSVIAKHGFSGSPVQTGTHGIRLKRVFRPKHSAPGQGRAS